MILPMIDVIDPGILVAVNVVYFAGSTASYTLTSPVEA